MRQVVLDTETTGLESSEGHRIIEIGCVELINRKPTERRYHQYLQPDREIDAGATEVHGITNESLAGKPRFGDIIDEFIHFIRDAELLIHNAPFDVGFINSELNRLDAGWGELGQYCSIVDTLAMARDKHPGQKNSLDALCKRYSIDSSQRELHGALTDAEILADVYLAMTGGQASLSLEGYGAGGDGRAGTHKPLPAGRPSIRIIQPTASELEAHQLRLEAIDEASNGQCVWKSLQESSASKG